MGLLNEVQKKREELKKRLEKPRVKQVIQIEVKKQRKPIIKVREKSFEKKTQISKEWIQTGVEGLDSLLGSGIPKGVSTIIAGGPGSGKTILCLQIAQAAAKKGEKVLYISLEEHPDRLRRHMADFNWNHRSLEKKGMLRIRRVDPFSISRGVEALLAKAKGELMIKIEEVGSLIPEDFKPEWVILDSITALQSAFKEEEETYRIYIEQLFRYFEKLEATSFLISETENIPKTYSKTGVEEFLADGVIVLYHIKKGNIRERAIEILKMRGVAHQSKIVAMQIISNKGIEIYPEQEIFGEIE